MPRGYSAHNQRAGRSLPEKLAYYQVQGSGCWGWTGNVSSSGYPTMFWEGRTHRTNRLAWQVANGHELLTHEMVLHRCDNPICTKPDHLYVGDHSQNMDDRNARGKSLHGTRNPHARLEPDQVRAIEKDPRRPLRLIAAEHGVSLSAVRRIKNGEGWRRLLSQEPT